MANLNNFNLPIFIIKAVRPLLSKGKLVFAYEINVTTEAGATFKIYENKGLNLSDYIGKKMECLLEITRGQFQYKDGSGKKPKTADAFQYLWLKRPFEFFPELMNLRESSNDDGKAMKQFDETATNFFNEWGLNGFGLGVYQAKPVLKASSGIFILNEFEFEEELKYMELDDEVYINIEELYLRGIRPVTSPKDSKPKPALPQPKPKVEPIQPLPKEEVPEKKKGRFDSLLE